MPSDAAPPGLDGAGTVAAHAIVATRWEEALELMAVHLDELREGLQGLRPMPVASSVVVPPTPMPQALRARARLLLAAQHDLEVVLRERVGILGAALHREPQALRAALSLYLDRCA